MNLATLRQEFPHTTHTIYLNHAATAPLSRTVMAAIQAYTEQRHASDIENYPFVLAVAEETRARLARLLHTSADRVEFAPNTSYALNVLALGLDWNPGDRIAVPDCEFPANVYPFMNLRRFGVEIDFIPTRDGVFTLDAIEQALTPRTRLLTVSWVQFLSGFKADLKAIGALCKARGVWFCVDAIQGLGALQLGDGEGVEACGIDFLAASGHKWMMATQGIGYLYLSEALQDRLTLAMVGWLNGPVDWENLSSYELTFHEDAARFRLGTLNSLGIIALHAALGLYFEAGPAWCEAQVLARSGQLAEGLARQGFERFGSDDPAAASGIVTVRHPEAEPVYEALKTEKIYASVRNRMLRFAPTYYNAPEEIDRTLQAVAAA